MKDSCCRVANEGELTLHYVATSYSCKEYHVDLGPPMSRVSSNGEVGKDRMSLSSLDTLQAFSKQTTSNSVSSLYMLGHQTPSTKVEQTLNILIQRSVYLDSLRPSKLALQFTLQSSGQRLFNLMWIYVMHFVLLLFHCFCLQSLHLNSKERKVQYLWSLQPGWALPRVSHGTIAFTTLTRGETWKVSRGTKRKQVAKLKREFVIGLESLIMIHRRMSRKWKQHSRMFLLMEKLVSYPSPEI